MKIEVKKNKKGRNRPCRGSAIFRLAQGDAREQKQTGREEDMEGSQGHRILLGIASPFPKDNLMLGPDYCTVCRAGHQSARCNAGSQVTADAV